MAEPVGPVDVPSPIVREWAHRRARWLCEMSGPRSLWAIGRHKPLGSVPARDDWRSDLLILFHRARLLGRGSAWYGDGIREHPCLLEPCVYAWHTRSLQAVLEHHVDVFHAAGWPTHSILAWIDHAAFHPVRPLTPLFDAVSDAYGDDWSPGRTDILPGVDRGVLLTAFANETCESDPSTPYFVEFNVPY